MPYSSAVPDRVPCTSSRSEGARAPSVATSEIELRLGSIASVKRSSMLDGGDATALPACGVDEVSSACAAAGMD